MSVNVNISTHLQAAESIALNEPNEWLRHAMTEPPVPPSELERIQREADSIMGLTRDGKSIVKIVWNGDKRYWKRIYRQWDSSGSPIGIPASRPILLYKTVYDVHGKILRDAFPPRYLILTRIEPEQYHDEWKASGLVFHPQYKKYIRLRPSEPPKDWYLWFATVADHDNWCCGQASENDVMCFGKYAHPAKALQTLREIRKGIEEAGTRSHPFEKASVATQRFIENRLNDYEEQALDSFEETILTTAAEHPLALASRKHLEEMPSLATLKASVADGVKEAMDQLREKALKDRLR